MVGVEGIGGDVLGAGGGVARATVAEAVPIAGQSAAGGVEAVEEEAGALGVDLVGGDEGEDLGEGELDAGEVVDVGHFEFVGGGMDSSVARAGAAGGVVVVAELLAAQGGGAATASGGVDVAAEMSLEGDLGEFGCVG